MAKFHVSRAFELPGQGAFVLAGTIVEGEVQAGMWLDFSSGVSCPRGPIHSVEVQSSGGSEGVWLIFKTNSEGLALWQLLNIRDEVMNVFEHPQMIAGLD